MPTFPSPRMTVPNELGDFLRARRAHAELTPPGAPARRRVTGLRREEVAAASGISVDYYTRLEQGRVAQPSDSVLDALARVLRLTPDAREHLYRLRPHADVGSEFHGDAGLLAQRMAQLVDAVRPNPAYVLDRLSNMVAVNPEGLELYAGFEELVPAQRNPCRYLLTAPRARDRVVEWREIARGAVAQLRIANAGDLQNADLQSLIAELRAASPLFGQWWNEHIVERRRASVKHLRMPDGEIIARRHEVLYLPEDGLRMTLWLGVGDSGERSQRRAGAAPWTREM